MIPSMLPADFGVAEPPPWFIVVGAEELDADRSGAARFTLDWREACAMITTKRPPRSRELEDATRRLRSEDQVMMASCSA
jgi:hypothetical protein